MTQETAQPQQPIQPQYFFEEDTISLLDILLVLAKHLKLIIITPTVFCIIAIIHVLFFTSPIYVSTATFMSSGSEGDNQSQMMGLASQFGIAMPRKDSSPKWSYEEVIKSRTMAKSLLVHRFNTEEFGPQKELLQIITYGNEKPEYGINTLLIQGIESVVGMIEVTKTASLFELEISASEPQLAADIANTVIVELDLHQRSYNARKTTETRQFIDERLLSTKAELEKAEETLKFFRERNRSIFESPQLQLEQERLGRDVAVLIGVFTTLKQQLETAKIDEVKESDYVIILDTPNIPLYPDKPKKKLIVILAGILGIGLGMIFAFIREYAENSDEEEQIKMGKAKSLILKNIYDFLPRRLRKIRSS
jgi:uncharacterized protein involved in exopolysaccharide biosynthesis